MNNEAFFKMPKVLFSEQFKKLIRRSKTTLWLDARQDTAICRK